MLCKSTKRVAQFRLNYMTRARADGENVNKVFQSNQYVSHCKMEIHARH